MLFAARFAIRLRLRRAAFLWIAPRFAARSSMLAASATASWTASPPFSIAERAVYTALRAAERATVLMVVRRSV